MNPLLCEPAEKAEREAANAAVQLMYIDDLVRVRGARELRESHVQELQRLAVEGIYPCAGKYRDARTRIIIGHQAPPAAVVPALVQEMVSNVNAWAETRPGYERAAYVMWRLNWIHPFAGGNGRSARAAAYLVACMHVGTMLPGRPIPAIILERRDKYIEALRAVDATIGEDGDFGDLSAMTDFVRGTLVEQLTSAMVGLADGVFGAPSRRR
jgi:Fic family protein